VDDNSHCNSVDERDDGRYQISSGSIIHTCRYASASDRNSHATDRFGREGDHVDYVDWPSEQRSGGFAMKRNSRVKGFTLLEILISLGILGVLLVAVLGLLRSASSSSTLLYNQSNMQEELRTASAIMSDELQRAYYVFPPQNSVVPTQGGSVSVTWSSFTLGTGNDKTGIHGSTSFTVNNNPSATNPQILAAITAPRRPDLYCGNNTEGCYQFVAYYAVERRRVTRGLLGNPATASSLLDSEPANNGRWVLMEIRVPLTAAVTASPNIPWNRVGCENLPSSDANFCSFSPVPDPNTSVQSGASLPALSCKPGCDIVSNRPSGSEAQTFGNRMSATVNYINSVLVNATPQILVDYLDEDAGFRPIMDNTTIDSRGIQRVSVSLRGRIEASGKSSTLSTVTMTVVPRNIAPYLP
jgi:prepilin-type N-terminal cleavage/methylation domain-containing protein